MKNTPTASASGAAGTPDLTFLLSATATPSEDGAIYHTVLEGQVPYTIATLYGIDVYDMLAKNGLDATAVIHVGDILLIRYANERLPGEVVITPTRMTADTSTGNSSLGPVASMGSLGAGATGDAVAPTPGSDLYQTSLTQGENPNSEVSSTTNTVADVEVMAKEAEAAPGIVQRIFSDHTKYLALAVILMVLLGLLLLVISTSRLRQ